VPSFDPAAESDPGGGGELQRLTLAQAPAAAAAAPSGGGELQRITVTGYIIPRVGEGTQPVLTLNRDFMERQGEQTVSDVISRLPQNSQNFTPLVNAGASFSPGASEANLYGVGTGSTLVLIDRKRQALFPFPQNGFQSFVDLNSIPLAAVERIEVLKDGASSIYGSDAIAGVINIILKDEYNGGDITGYWGISQRGDDEVYHVQAVGGISHKFNENSKFSIVATFDYYENSPIDAIDRSFSSNVDHAIRGPDLGDLRSFSPPAGNFIGLTSGNLFSVVPGSNGNPANLVVNGPGNFYNTVPGVQLLPRETRFGTYAKMTYQPFQFQLYDDFFYQHNEEKANFTASPVTSSDFIVTPATNPFNPTGEDLDTRLRLLGLGQRLTDTTIQNVRNVAGIRLFNLPKNWFADASFLYAESDGDSFESNFITKSGVNRALAGTIPGFTGVFFNPFVDQNILTPQNQAILNALKINPDQQARTALVQWSLTTGGELFDLPAGPVTLGLGAEYRSNEYEAVKDFNSRTNNVLAQGGSGNANRKDYVKATYGQITIPIIGG
jgi:iron complex outermembrane receptor protein